MNAGVEEQEKTTKLGSTLSALQAAASDFKRYKKRPAALIIDNADQLSRSEDILRHILFTGTGQTIQISLAMHLGFLLQELQVCQVVAQPYSLLLLDVVAFAHE